MEHRPSYENPMIAAATSGDLAAVKSLLAESEAAPINLNAQGKDGRTALHHAVLGKHDAMVKTL